MPENTIHETNLLCLFPTRLYRKIQSLNRQSLNHQSSLDLDISVHFFLDLSFCQQTKFLKCFLSSTMLLQASIGRLRAKIVRALQIWKFLYIFSFKHIFSTPQNTSVVFSFLDHAFTGFYRKIQSQNHQSSLDIDVSMHFFIQVYIFDPKEIFCIDAISQPCFYGLL